MLDARERAQRRPRSPRPARPAARAAAVAAAAFSRLCAPGMRGSAGSASSPANSTRRPDPGLHRTPGARSRHRRRSGSRRSAASRRGTRRSCRGGRCDPARGSAAPRSAGAATRRPRAGTTTARRRPRRRATATDEARQRPPDVAGDLGRHAGGVEHRTEQRGRRRLAVRARDPEERVREHPCAELDLARSPANPRARAATTGGVGRALLGS